MDQVPQDVAEKEVVARETATTPNDAPIWKDNPEKDEMVSP
jgi:hypothetical protein